MASPHSFLRRMRLIILVLAVLVPAVAVGAVEASAGPRIRHTAAADRDDLNQMRIDINQLRMQNTLRAARESARIEAALHTPAELARASRNLERKLLTNNVYVRPVPGPVTQWYSPHPGIDIAPAVRHPDRRRARGVVTFVGWDDGYGMHVEVAQADGYVTTYSHMSALDREGRPARRRRPAARQRRQHRLLDRPAPALRGAHAERAAHGPGDLALRARRHSVSRRRL